MAALLDAHLDGTVRIAILFPEFGGARRRPAAPSWSGIHRVARIYPGIKVGIDALCDAGVEGVVPEA